MRPTLSTRCAASKAALFTGGIFMYPSAKQLIIISDMEGASGIFEHNKAALYNGGEQWRDYGRHCLTSDILAVSEAAQACGIDDILLYDAHYAGNAEYNVILAQLPKTVRVFDVLDRCTFWRRIRGQAQQHPFGLITVGQHARNGEPDAYFPHTIQSPPMASLLVNGRSIAEIGSAAYQFCGTPYLANIGCQASMKEATEICPTVHCIPVKDKRTGWQPSPQETFPLIKEGVIQAITQADQKQLIALDGPYAFEMTLTPGFYFQPPQHLSWVGSFADHAAHWLAPSVEIGLELFENVRSCIRRCT